MQSFTFATLISAAMAISANELSFMNYAAQYNKVYEDVEEFATRLERFMHHDKVIKEHNDSNDSKNFILGHNQFSDWTDAEYLDILGYRPPEFSSWNAKN